MDALQIRFLADLVRTGPCEKAAGPMAEHFHAQQRIGLRVGRKSNRFEYAPADIDHVKKLLLAHGITPDALAVKPKDRADAAIPGISEKVGIQALRAEDVVVKALTPGCSVHGVPISAGLPGYSVMPLHDAIQMDVDAILVVENLETVKQIHRYRWIRDHALWDSRVVVVFRGDSVNKADVVNALLRSRSDPVWSFPDFDPAGLGLASKLPRLQGLVFPWDLLEPMARERQLIDLYDNQVDQWRATLNAVEHPDFKRAWTLMQALKLGLNQEALRSD